MIKKFAIELNSKLNNYEDMILSLNVEVDSNYKEIEEYRELYKIKKDLR